MSISEKLKQARSKTDLTQEAVAEKVGVSRQTVYNWEQGRSYPDIASIMILSDIYNVSLDSLLKGDIDMIKHLEEGSGGTNKVKYVIVSVLALVVVLLGIWLSIIILGVNAGYFMDLPSLLMILIPLLFVLTITRSFKLFSIGFSTLLFPKRKISDEQREQAISLFRLMTKTVLLAVIISMIIGFVGMGAFMDFSDPESINNLFRNININLILPLYGLIMILVIFEPIVFILKKK